MPVPARADEGIDAVIRGLGRGSKYQKGACEEYGAFGKMHGVEWGGKLRMLGAKIVWTGCKGLKDGQDGTVNSRVSQ